MITIIDYGLGNVGAIANLYKRINIDFKFAKCANDLTDATKLILPGVGAFDNIMLRLQEKGLIIELNKLVVNKKIPILGVCVGMHVMGSTSEEGTEKGFGWINGTVKKLDINELPGKPYLPHMGWNSISCKERHLLFNNINLEQGFYFLHSYYFDCDNSFNKLATTKYGTDFSSAIFSNNVFGVQFHPEKSHNNGIQLYKNFALL